MKKTKISAVILSSLVLFIFTACHTETPLGIDREAPFVELLMIYNDTDTLYNAADTTSVFNDFDQSITEGEYFLKLAITDNNSIYQIKLFAEDRYSGQEYDVLTFRDVEQGDVLLKIQYTDFPAVQDQNPQEFYLSCRAYDDSENSMSTSKVGFNVAKVFPFNIMYEELGLIEEIEGDSIDFREKNGKLAFVQFMYKGCFSCVEEARDVKAMYQDPSYDREYSHSMFGRSFDSEKQFLDFKLRDERLPFDCFLDQPDNKAKTFFEKLTGEVIETAFFAVMPNGKIVEFKHDMEFSVWLDLMYSTAYPNN